MTCRSSSEKTCRIELDASEEAQVEGAGDLNGFQGDGGGAEREGDGIDHLRVHQQLWTHTTISQTSLKQ